MFVRQLDLTSLSSVRKFAAGILKSESRLDILINNAGCATIEKKLTEDGLEVQMQSNHFGHFLLTNLLLGKFFRRNFLYKRKLDNGRCIVPVDSSGLEFISFTNLSSLTLIDLMKG